jgi:hypothetical protein
MEEFLNKLFPNLTDDVIETTIDRLVEIGASELEDLAYLEEADSSGILKPIQVRKLLQHAKGLPIYMYISGVARTVIGGHIFIYLCSALLKSFEINCCYGM